MTTAPTMLGDVCELINGGAWKQTEYVDDGIPVVQVSNMKNGTIDVSDLKFLPPTSYDRYKKHTLKECDIVIATVGSHATQASAAGRATIVKGFVAGMLLNQNAVAIRSKSESLDQGYLGLIGRSDKFQFYLGTVGQGAANQVRIALSAIKEYKCDLPPIGVQRRIAEVISAYDDLIENNRRRIQLLEQAARLLYREWFVHLRFPGHEHATIADGVPEGWEKKPLGDIANTNVGSYKARGLPDKINYIDISSVAQGRIVTKNAILSSNAPGRARRKAMPGDVIWSNVRPNLRAYALVLDPEENDVFSTGFTVLSPVAVPFSYLYLLVTTDEFVGHLVNHATGAGYPAVRPDDFERAIVLTPSKVVLELFHERAEPIYRFISVLTEEAKGLTKARDLLLPRLMNGEVAV